MTTIPAISSDEELLAGLSGRLGLDEAEALMGRLAVGARLDRVGAVAHRHLLSGGRRTRARLALAAAEALGVDRLDAAPWAAACELLHQASLVHDDIQDGDPVRRERAAVWATEGVPAAINTGDLLLVLPWLAIAETPCPEVVRLALVRAAAVRAVDTVRGQGRDLDLLPSELLDRHHWEAAARGKSGSLLALPVEGAALLARLTEDTAGKLAEPFVTLGMLYQACDDVTDLYGDKGRGAPGNDLREGKVSLLVIEHVRLHPSDKGELLEVLNLPRERTTDELVTRWITRFREGGALTACVDRVARLEREVLDDRFLRSVPDLHAVAAELVGGLVSSLLASTRVTS